LLKTSAAVNGKVASPSVTESSKTSKSKCC